MEDILYCYWIPVAVSREDEATLVNTVFLQWQNRPIRLAKREKSRVVKMTHTKVPEKRESEQRVVRQAILQLLARSERPMPTKQILHTVCLQSGVPKILAHDLATILQSLCDAGHICSTRRGRKNKLWSLCESESINDGL